MSQHTAVLERKAFVGKQPMPADKASIESIGVSHGFFEKVASLEPGAEIRSSKLLKPVSIPPIMRRKASTVRQDSRGLLDESRANGAPTAEACAINQCVVRKMCSLFATTRADREILKQEEWRLSHCRSDLA